MSNHTADAEGDRGGTSQGQGSSNTLHHADTDERMEDGELPPIPPSPRTQGGPLIAPPTPVQPLAPSSPTTRSDPPLAVSTPPLPAHQSAAGSTPGPPFGEGEDTQANSAAHNPSEEPPQKRQCVEQPGGAGGNPPELSQEVVSKRGRGAKGRGGGRGRGRGGGKKPRTEPAGQGNRRSTRNSEKSCESCHKGLFPRFSVPSLTVR